MKKKILKYGLWSLVLCVTSPFASAQSIARTAYFMDNTTNRHLMNPALTPTRGYFSLPVVGDLSLGVESNMAFTDFIYPAVTPGGELLSFLSPDVDAADFLSRIDPNNFLRMDIRTSILSLGFYSGTDFWTFDVAGRVNMSLNLPYDLFAFAKVGKANSTNEYHLDNLSIGAGAFTEFALGYSRNIMNNLRVGGKIKYLAGIANVKAYLEKMDIYMSDAAWTVTTEGQMNVYGKGLTFQKDEDQNINGVDINSPGMGGAGMAFDIGATYSPICNLDVSAAIIDLGGIKWKKSNILQANSSGTTTYTGLENIGNQDDDESNSTKDQLENLKDDLIEMAHFKEQAVSGDYTQKLFPTINAGAEYTILKDKLSLGMLYTARIMEDENYSELMGALNLRPSKWFNLSGSYSFLHGKGETFGFALGFMPGIINIFMACDYTFLKVTPQYIPLNTMTSNFQLGVSIPLGPGHLPDKH